MTASLFLRDKDRVALEELLKRHVPDVTVWAYGSRVNGMAHDASDLDLVLRSADLSPIPREKMEALTDAIRNSNIPILIEARDWARLPASFHRQILRNYYVLRENAGLDPCRDSSTE